MHGLCTGVRINCEGAFGTQPSGRGGLCTDVRINSKGVFTTQPSGLCREVVSVHLCVGVLLSDLYREVEVKTDSKGDLTNVHYREVVRWSFIDCICIHYYNGTLSLFNVMYVCMYAC